MLQRVISLSFSIQNRLPEQLCSSDGSYFATVLNDVILGASLTLPWLTADTGSVNVMVGVLDWSNGATITSSSCAQSASVRFMFHSKLLYASRMPFVFKAVSLVSLLKERGSNDFPCHITTAKVNWNMLTLRMSKIKLAFFNINSYYCWSYKLDLFAFWILLRESWCLLRLVYASVAWPERLFGFEFPWVHLPRVVRFRNPCRFWFHCGPSLLTF